MALNSPDDNQDRVIAEFGLLDGDDSWIDQLRRAEQSGAMGNLGRYQLLDEVARGGQGVVYCAFDPDTSRQVAIKVVSAGRLASAARLSRVKRELEAIVKLDHPSVVTLYGAEWIDGVPALIMKWVDGVPYNEWAMHDSESDLETTPSRSDEQLAGIMLEICAGLQQAHQRGVIHRDLKPSNVLIDGDGHPQILDFGLAKLEQDDEDANVTRDGEFLGTVRYAAPEQFQHGAGAADVRSDVFSLGAMLLESVAGVYHPTGSTDSRWVQALLPGIKNRNWRAVLRKSVAIDPKDRYQSIESFAQDLKALLQNAPVMARNQTAVEVLFNTARRYPRSVAIGIVVSLVITGLAVAMSLLYQQAREESTKARAALELFEQALSPAKANLPATQLTVAHVLAQVSKRLSDSLDLPHDVRAHAHNVIARHYAVSGMWQEAAIEAWAAEQAIRELNDPYHAELAQALKARGNAAAVRLDPISVDLHRRSVAILTEIHGEESREVASGLIALSYALWRCNRGDRSDIESMLRDGIAVHLDLGCDELELGVAYWLLGDFLAQDGRSDEAIAYASKAAPALAEHVGIGAYHWNLSIQSHARLLFGLQRDDEAHGVLDNAIADCKTAKRPLAQASFHWLRGEHWHAREQHSLALDAYKRSIQLRAEAFPKTDLLAEAEGVSFMNHWHRLLQSAGGSTFQPVLSARSFARALSKSGENIQAAELLQLAIDHFGTVINDRMSSLALSIRIERAHFLTLAAEFDTAESVLREVRQDIIGTNASTALRLACEEALNRLAAAAKKSQQEKNNVPEKPADH